VQCHEGDWGWGTGESGRWWREVELAVTITTEAKNIANDTEHDSTSTVAIDTLTMVFLLLLFVATLLGMPIFN